MLQVVFGESIVDVFVVNFDQFTAFLVTSGRSIFPGLLLSVKFQDAIGSTVGVTDTVDLGEGGKGGER